MDNELDYTNIISRLDETCEELDSVRMILSRCEYELSSNIICGRTMDNGNLKRINNTILDIVNDLEILKSNYEVKRTNL